MISRHPRKPFPSILAFLVVFLTTPIVPALSEEYPLNVTQTVDAGEELSWRASASVPALEYRFASRGPMPGPSRREFPELSPRSWTVSLTPSPSLALFAGSISWSGLPARVAKPVRDALSPFAAVPGVRSAATLGSSWAAGREYAGMEIRTTYFGLAAFCSPRKPFDNPAWLQLSAGIPLESDARPALSLTAFSGLAPRDASTPDSWYLDAPAVPARSVFIPGAELAFDLGPVSANIVGMANLGPFANPGIAVMADASVSAGPIHASIAWYKGDPGFVGLTGGVQDLRDSLCGACGLDLPLSRNRAESFRLGGCLAVERTGNLSATEAGTTRVSGGGEIRLSLTAFRLDLTASRDENALKASARIVVPELVVPILSLECSARAGFPGGFPHAEGWVDGKLAAKLKLSALGPVSAGVECAGEQARPGSACDLGCGADLAFRNAGKRADWTLSGRISVEPRRARVSGSATLSVDFR